MSSTYRIIKTDEELTNYCIGIKDRIAIDTEFIRIRTFYPQLGLIQLFDGESVALVDPLTITVWDPFVAVLANPQIQKYLHACSEDIDVFLHYFGLIPTPIIDSQILASFLDNPISSGYATLVKKYLGVDLDKSEVRTNWLQRPLSVKQCAYAINDVFYLIPLMEKLKALLLDNGWLNAAYEECALAVNRKRLVVDPEQSYLKIKNGWQLNGRGLALLKRLASWRYNLAKSSDTSLNFVIHEELLWKIARYKPTSLAELANLGLKGKEIRHYGETVLALLSEPITELPPIKRISSYPDYKETTMLLKEAAKAISKQSGLSVELLISRRFINHYVKWQHDKTAPQPEILTGWRKPYFEQALLNR